MLCPRCQSQLRRKFYRDKLHFRCPKCGGRVQTFASLRSLCGDPQLMRTLWYLAKYEPAGSGLPCPECGEAMSRVLLPLSADGPVLELDVCCKPRCQLVWFDAGEFEALPEAVPTAAPKEELSPELREKLALLAVRQVEERARRELPPTADLSAADCLLAFFGVPVRGGPVWSGKVPWITAALSLVCIAVFLLTSGDLPGTFRHRGLIPAEPWRLGGATWFSAMFIHGGVGHLVGNLAFLIVFGDRVEAALKKRWYLLLVLFGGLAAAATHCLCNPGSTVPCGGASGFVSAVLGCFAVLFPREPLTVIFHLHPVTLPAWCYVALWFITQLAAGILAPARAGGTAFMAHVGGTAAGVLAGILLLRCQRESELLTGEKEKPF